MTDPNSYSPQWFDFFHHNIAEERTTQEIDFICACAPLPNFGRVLDLCCGMGRHARALVQRGYSVTGIERDVGAIVKARELNDGPEYVHADIRDYHPENSAYDLAIVMSQSFGYFDSKTNRDLLQRVVEGIRHGGRIILDLWNPQFFVTHQGERTLETVSGTIRERKRMEADRLFVDVSYPDGARESFEWQLFTPEEMKSLGESVGLALIVVCTNFDAGTKPNSANPRIQFVLER